MLQEFVGIPLLVRFFFFFPVYDVLRNLALYLLIVVLRTDGWAFAVSAIKKFAAHSPLSGRFFLGGGNFVDSDCSTPFLQQVGGKNLESPTVVFENVPYPLWGGVEPLNKASLRSLIMAFTHFS